MVHIILLILKIAGIILLSVLGLILLLLAAVLFVPVTYRVQAEKEESVRIRAAGGWMFRMLSVHYLLEGEERDLVFRLFGIPIYRPWAEKKDGEPKKRKPKKKKKARKQAVKKKEQPPEPPSGKSSEPSSEPPDENRTEPPSGMPDENKPAPPEFPAREPERDAEAEAGRGCQASDGDSWKREAASQAADGTDQKRESVFRKAAYAIRRFCDRIRHIWNACLKIPRKIRSLLDRKDQFLEFWDLEEHRQARSAIWKEFLYLRDKLRPKKVKGYIHFGFEDPSATGICMGAASVLYAWYPDQFELRPDFEQEILEGQLFFRGRLRLYALVLIALRVWFNRDIRNMYRHWKEL